MVKIENFKEVEKHGFVPVKDAEGQYFLSLFSCRDEEDNGVGLIINPNTLHEDGEVFFHSQFLIPSSDKSYNGHNIYEGLDECVKLDKIFELLRDGVITYVDSSGKQYKLVELGG